jgi:hypothetical protein
MSIKKFILTILAIGTALILCEKVQSTPLKLFYEFTKGKPQAVGSGSRVAKTGYVLTTAHILTLKFAEKKCSTEEQIKKLKEHRVIYLSPKMICKNKEVSYIDAAVLLPESMFKVEVLDSSKHPVSLGQDADCLDESYLISAKTGGKHNLVKFLNYSSLRSGDSGAVAVHSKTNEAVAVYWGHGNKTLDGDGYPVSYFFPLDMKPGLMASIRLLPGKVKSIRQYPKGCKEYNPEQPQED